ncbi:MAG: hypothetical protein JNL32_14390 [Candidatus Kapabacteria bacterium]|nr:hypothetical protein [Candidatus Kapabacteria bacterium]
MKQRLIIALLVIVCSTHVVVLHCQQTQQDQAKQLINAVVKKFKQVKDYKADVLITLDVDFVKAPPAKGTLYFKQPNKFRLISTDFAMLPKQSLNMSPVGILQSEDVTLIPSGTTVLQGKQCSIIRVVPNIDTGEVVAAKLYIEPNSALILKSETTTKKSGTLSMVFEYKSFLSNGLPDKMTIAFDVPEFKLPKSMSGDIASQDKNEKPKRSTGSVTITYTSYSLNKGVADTIFK